MNRLLFSTPLFLSLFGVAACGSVNTGSGGSGTGGSGGTTGTTTTPSGGGAPTLRGECPSDQQVGYFYVEHEVDYSVVSGEVLTGVVPSKIKFEVGKEGDCTLWQRKNPFCNPACGASEACGQDGKCVPFPVPEDAGPVTIDGLTKKVAMVYPNYFDTTVDHPAFQPGAFITLGAEGAAFPKFTLYGRGFKPMEIPATKYTLKKGEPLDVTWTKDDQAVATVSVRINVDQHGNSPVELVCELADTGSIAIPSTLIDKLIDFGVTGFPSIHISRHTVDSVNPGGGCVEFEVYSHRLGDLEVADHLPCDPSHPCPVGYTCDVPTGTCM
ncbi:MAG: hypothetical protein U0441_17510 [Polyangiaceae bacterium]